MSFFSISNRTSACSLRLLRLLINVLILADNFLYAFSQNVRCTGCNTSLKSCFVIKTFVTQLFHSFPSWATLLYFTYSFHPFVKLYYGLYINNIRMKGVVRPRIKRIRSPKILKTFVVFCDSVIMTFFWRTLGR